MSDGYEGASGEFVRDMIARACATEDERGKMAAFHEGRRADRNTDEDGYLLRWNGVPMTWGTYWDMDYYGTGAVRVTGELESGKQVVLAYWPDRDVEERMTLVDPMIDVPDNAHWKGWVW